MNRRRIVTLLVSLACPGCSEAPEELPAEAPSPLTEGEAEAVHTTSWVGVIAGRSIDLSSKVAGSVVEVPVTLGQAVSAEQLLVRILVPGLDEEIAIAEAQHTTARAQVRRARVDVDDAEKRLDIEKRLVHSGSTSKEAVTTAEGRWKRAKAELEVAQGTQLEVEASLTRLRNKQDQALVRAPAAGHVATIYVASQANVEVGAPLLRFMESVSPKLKFAVPPGEAAALANGTRVVARDEQGREASATVEHVAPEVDSASGLLTVEAKLDAASFLPGTIVRVQLEPRV